MPNVKADTKTLSHAGKTV